MNVSEMTYYVSSGTLNPAQSISQSRSDIGSVGTYNEQIE